MYKLKIHMVWSYQPIITIITIHHHHHHHHHTHHHNYHHHHLYHHYHILHHTHHNYHYHHHHHHQHCQCIFNSHQGIFFSFFHHPIETNLIFANLTDGWCTLIWNITAKSTRYWRRNRSPTISSILFCTASKWAYACHGKRT